MTAKILASNQLARYSYIVIVLSREKLKWCLYVRLVSFGVVKILGALQHHGIIMNAIFELIN